MVKHIERLKYGAGLLFVAICLGLAAVSLGFLGYAVVSFLITFGILGYAVSAILVFLVLAYGVGWLVGEDNA